MYALRGTLAGTLAPRIGHVVMIIIVQCVGLVGKFLIGPEPVLAPGYPATIAAT